uniref:SCAN domaincontaining protein 3like [Haplochromis burtoni] n=1 Tax=Lepeophtheirus salmonis TaxID=72036 RepID=A0A0K2VFH6_LEPSM
MPKVFQLNLSLQKTKLSSKIKVLHLKQNSMVCEQRNIGHVRTLSRILCDTKCSCSLTKLVHYHLSSLLKEFECNFPILKDPRTAKKCIRDNFPTN